MEHSEEVAKCVYTNARLITYSCGFANFWQREKRTDLFLLCIRVNIYTQQGRTYNTQGYRYATGKNIQYAEHAARRLNCPLYHPGNHPRWHELCNGCAHKIFSPSRLCVEDPARFGAP